jgi:hypothetical protein
MIRLLVRTTFITALVALACVVIIGRARAATTYQSPVLDPGQCPLPCWMGMRFNSTTLTQAGAYLETRSELVVTQRLDEMVCFQFTDDQPMDRGCVRSFRGISYPDNTIAHIALWSRSNRVRLGDLLLLYGKPTAIDLKCDGKRPSNIYFAGNLFAAIPSDVQALNPFVSVEYLNLVTASSTWSGFKPKSWDGFSRCAILVTP